MVKSPESILLPPLGLVGTTASQDAPFWATTTGDTAKVQNSRGNKKRQGLEVPGMVALS